MDRFLSTLEAHPRWFFVGCMVAGAAVVSLPFLREPNGNMAVLPYLATWTLAGLIAGFLAPDRPWRWALAMVLPLPILATVLDPNPGAALLLQLVTLPLLPVMAVPILVGAYGGRALSGARRPVPGARSAPGPSVSRQVKLFLLSYLLCTVPGLFMPGGSNVQLVTWAVTAAASSTLLVAAFQLPPLRSTALVIAAVIGAFMTAVIRDSMVGGPRHNLLPLELWIVLLVTFLPAGVSAHLASLLRKRGSQRG